MSSADKARHGALLLNLGSPTAPTTSAVRRYLQEFLMDPDVIDIAWPLRALLVYGPISLFRAGKSAHAYEKVWIKESRPGGAPLLHYSQLCLEKLREKISLPIELGMRYQNPSIGNALDSLPLNELDELRVLPLYPQYALSSTLTAEKKVLQELKRRNFKGRIKMLNAFYDFDPYLEAQAATARSLWESGRYDYLLFSFHGVPERQIERLRTNASDCLIEKSCCENPKNLSFCYRAQAFHNAQSLAKKLNLPVDSWSVSFQSRLGRTPWIKPYTDEVLPDLVKKGKKRLLVLCPSFVADCLETLEEIAIRERESFLAAGGQDLQLIPSLNDSEIWINALGSLISGNDDRFRSVDL